MFTRERYNLELKETVTKRFLKTVSAYANYNDGKIIFGIDDEMEYEKRKAPTQNLNFDVLKQELKDKTGIKRVDLDILRTLNLYDRNDYYNIAGELLADENQMNFSGVDIVRFGPDEDRILYRETIRNKSLLLQYSRALAIFEQYYQYEEIEGYERERKELVPREAFREALANAMIHRVWDVNSYIQISMYDPKIEISSPGGLPGGLSRTEYLHNNISVLRNPIIAGVFYRLGIIEKFGTGVARINRAYADSLSKPDFEIGENSLRVVLPVIRQDHAGLVKDEIEVYTVLKREAKLSRKELDEALGFDKSKTIRMLNNLMSKNLIQKQGQGPGTTYRIL